MGKLFLVKVGDKIQLVEREEEEKEFKVFRASELGPSFGLVGKDGTRFNYKCRDIEKEIKLYNLKDIKEWFFLQVADGTKLTYLRDKPAWWVEAEEEGGPDKNTDKSLSPSEFLE